MAVLVPDRDADVYRRKRERERRKRLQTSMRRVDEWIRYDPKIGGLMIKMDPDISERIDSADAKESYQIERGAGWDRLDPIQRYAYFRERFLV
jgi:hypothetical protein